MTRRINSTAGSIGLLATVSALWLVSIARLRESAIGSYGLLSALPVTMYAGLALLTFSMILVVHRGAPGRLAAAHVVLFVLMVHGTPAAVYDTLRYAWAWKHLGLVDYLASHHTVDPSAGDLRIYQSWPGFFSATTTWLVGSNLRSWTGLVQWAPVVFELAFAGAVLAVLRSLEPDRRVVWLAVWLFVVANWVGQDYFSPQAFAFFLYLAVLAIVCRRLVRRPAMPAFARRLVRDGCAPDAGDPGPPADRAETRTAIVLVLLCSVAIVTSHPLTPLVTVVALAALAFVRVLRVRVLPALVAAPVALWFVTGARHYIAANARQLLGQAGAFNANVGATLSKAGHADASQVVVSRLGRLEVALVVVLALVGLARRIRAGRWDLAALVLAAMPVSILAGGSYGGEAVFRVYLFALPFAAYFAATAFYTTPDAGRRGAAVAALACCAVLVVGFLFAYYGKEQWAHFTRGEVRAAQVVFDRAEPRSLLVEGTADFPTHFANYADFTYVDLSAEPARSSGEVIAHPVTTLQRWLSDPRYRHSYLIITRSQKDEADALGQLPRGALDRVERALLASSRFRVLYHDADAAVFTIAPPSSPSSPAVPR